MNKIFNIYKLASRVNLIRDPLINLNLKPAFLYVQPKRFAGHSKWQNIKHIKAAKDKQKSLDIQKLNYKIKVAVKESGGNTDPKLNKKLADILEQAKLKGLPKESMQKTIDRLKAAKGAYKQYSVTFKGPNGCYAVVDTETDNLNRIKMDINSIIKRWGGTLAQDSVLYLFDHQGSILCSKFKGNPVSEEFLEEALTHAIEAGAEDVVFISKEENEEIGPALEFKTSPESFHVVSQTLEKMDYTLDMADLEYIPKNPLKLEEMELQKLITICDKLKEKDDIVNVFVNAY